MKLRPFAAALAALLIMAGCTPQPVEPSPTPDLSPVPTPTPDPVPANTYLAEAFTVTDGFLTYDGDAPSLVGVDVSSHQKEIDWEMVRAAGVDFAMLRAGYRGYTEGALFEDEYYRRNIEGALAAGLEVGVYFFSQAVTPAEAVEEAGFLMGLIKEYDVTFPVVFDWERQSAETSRTRQTDGETVTDCAAAFCTAVEAAGYLPMVYFSPKKGYDLLDLERLMEWPFWLAHYTTDWQASSFRYDFAMWQYSCTGSVDGVETDVDLNLCLTDFSGWGKQPEPEEPDQPEGSENTEVDQP